MNPASCDCGPSAGAAARLRIHAGRSTRHRRAADVKALWQRWIERAPLPEAAHPVVEVAAEPGHRLFALSDPQGSAEVTVSAGTCDITVVAGRRTSRDMVTLDPGATIDLDLQDAMQAD